MTTHPIQSWKVHFRQDAPAQFQVPEEVSKSILHAIDGIDPHNPVFYSNRCYPCKLWHCVIPRCSKDVDEDDKRVCAFVKTPLTPSKCGRTTNLRALLAYHFFGHMETPKTSSRLPCVCGSGKLYGNCCFPQIHSTCYLYMGVRDSGLCLNPFHLQIGKSSDPEPGSHAPFKEVIVNPCEKCKVCGWEPYELQANNKTLGYIEEPCSKSISIGVYNFDDVRRTFRSWKSKAKQAYATSISKRRRTDHIIDNLKES
jgi:hypothetical protein